MTGLGALLRDRRSMVLVSWRTDGRLQYKITDALSARASVGTGIDGHDLERIAIRHAAGLPVVYFVTATARADEASP